MRPKYGLFSNQTDIVIFLSSGVARQQREARADLIALLPYGFSNLRYYKHSISDNLVYNNEKFRSFKSKENIHKKEVGPYRGFGY